MNMMDMIAGAFGTLKTASEITQGLLTLKTDAAVSAKAVELNRVIFEVQQQLFNAQTDYAAVLARVRDLEAEIAKCRDWEKEKDRYQLHALAPDTWVMRLRPVFQNSEPVHDLCPNCFEDGHKSYLQGCGTTHGRHAFQCNKCGSSFLGSTATYSIPTARRDYDPYA